MAANDKVEIRIDGESGVPHYYRVGDSFALCGRRDTPQGTATADVCPICSKIQSSFNLQVA